MTASDIEKLGEALNQRTPPLDFTHEASVDQITDFIQCLSDVRVELASKLPGIHMALIEDSETRHDCGLSNLLQTSETIVYGKYPGAASMLPEIQSLRDIVHCTKWLVKANSSTTSCKTLINSVIEADVCLKKLTSIIACFNTNVSECIPKKKKDMLDEHSEKIQQMLELICVLLKTRVVTYTKRQNSRLLKVRSILSNVHEILRSDYVTRFEISLQALLNEMQNIGVTNLSESPIDVVPLADKEEALLNDNECCPILRTMESITALEKHFIQRAKALLNQREQVLSYYEVFDLSKFAEFLFASVETVSTDTKIKAICQEYKRLVTSVISISNEVSQNFKQVKEIIGKLIKNFPNTAHSDNAESSSLFNEEFQLVRLFMPMLPHDKLNERTKNFMRTAYKSPVDAEILYKEYIDLHAIEVSKSINGNDACDDCRSKCRWIDPSVTSDSDNQSTDEIIIHKLSSPKVKNCSVCRIKESEQLTSALWKVLMQKITCQSPVTLAINCVEDNVRDLAMEIRCIIHSNAHVIYKEMHDKIDRKCDITDHLSKLLSTLQPKTNHHAEKNYYHVIRKHYRCSLVDVFARLLSLRYKPDMFIKFIEFFLSGTSFGNTFTNELIQ